MICKRCGYCCIHLSVVIVNPEFVDSYVGQEEEKYYLFKTSGEKCPYLSLDSENKAVCKIHNKSWYKNTPCFEYTQIESSVDDFCRTGEHLTKNNLLDKFILPYIK